MPGFDKHIARVAKAMPTGGEEVSALRGALRGAVHGRGMPVDAVHSGAGSDLSGLTVLMVAAQRGRADAIKVLLREFGAGAGAVADSTSARAALGLAVSGNHTSAASELRAWLGDRAGGDASEDGEIVDDGEDGEVAVSIPAQAASRSEATSSRSPVFARLKMTGGAAASRGTNTGNHRNSAASAGDTVMSPKWKKAYSELSFAEKLRLLKTPAAAPADDSPAPNDVQSRQADVPQNGWVRFGAVHSQWRDHLDIRSDGSFTRVSRDDGGRWSEARWQDEQVGEITIHWANWDVSDTLHTTDGGASFHAVGTNQWGDEYQFALKATETSGGEGAGGGRSIITLPAWFNPAAPEVKAASGEFRGKSRRRDRPPGTSSHDGAEQSRKRARESNNSGSMVVPQASRLKVLERGAKFGTLTAEQQSELAELRRSSAEGTDIESIDAAPSKMARSAGAASSSSLDDDMDDYFKR